MVSCAHLSVALRVALGASTWPGKRGFTIRRSSPTQRRNGRAFSSLTARGGGLPIGVSPDRGLWRRTQTIPSSSPPAGRFVLCNSAPGGEVICAEEVEERNLV